MSTSSAPASSQVLRDAAFSGLQVIHASENPCRRSRGAMRRTERAAKAFWQNESYDHLVRSETEFRRIRRYIEINQVKAGLVAAAEEFRWSSASAA